jgi:transcription initiation factor IIE alpha subunit
MATKPLEKETQWSELVDTKPCYWRVDRDAINYYVAGCECKESKVSFDVELVKHFSYCPDCGLKLKLTDECSTTH